MVRRYLNVFTKLYLILSRSIGYNGESEFEGKRVVQLFMYARMFPEDNHYAHPLDFVVGIEILFNYNYDFTSKFYNLLFCSGRFECG